jgi:hypothetical protein
VLNGGQLPVAGNISVQRDGSSQGAEARVMGNSGLDVRTGDVSFGIRVQNGTGEVRTLPNGSPDILVDQGARALIQGGGFLPFSSAQVFLPLQGGNAIELARVQIDASGNLEGEANFRTGPGQAPIPIGPQVLQIVTVGANGEQIVVDLTVTVAQPGPLPELDRNTGEIPTMTPGQSFATVAGLPVDVRIDVNPQNGTTTIDGGDWTMEVGLNGETSQVTTGPDGALVVELERDSLAAISGTGFMAQTRVDVWLFSTPTLLGTIVTDEDGSFEGFVSVDSRTVAVGAHTLQLQGIGTDGYVRSANMGVVVSDTLGDAPTSAWAWWWWAIIGGLLGLGIWFVFMRRENRDDDGELEAYDPSKRHYRWSVTENSPKRGGYRADLIGLPFAIRS